MVFVMFNTTHLMFVLLHPSIFSRQPCRKLHVWIALVTMLASGNLVVQAPFKKTTTLSIPVSQEKADTMLSKRFALMEVKGDWKWLMETWQFTDHYWKAGKICWRCPATRIPRLAKKQHESIRIYYKKMCWSCWSHNKNTFLNSALQVWPIVFGLRPGLGSSFYSRVYQLMFTMPTKPFVGDCRFPCCYVESCLVSQHG